MIECIRCKEKSCISLIVVNTFNEYLGNSVPANVLDTGSTAVSKTYKNLFLCVIGPTS